MVKTKENRFEINVYSKFVERNNLKMNVPFFNKMCEDGCVNYCKKYSCPPFCPEIDTLVKFGQSFFVVLFSCDLKQINSTEYNKVRIANSVMKSRIEKLMRILEDKFKMFYLSTGSCRLCRPCKYKLKLPCKYPLKMRYSLEALGVDCDNLSRNLFGKHLLWYKNKQAPEYTSVLCALVCDAKDKEFVKSSFTEEITKLFECT